MAEEKYSWENLIFNPTTDEAKNAVGKEVYYSDSPLNCIDYADKDNTEFLGVLDSASESNAPFYIRDIGNWTCIIVKKEPCYKDQVKQWIEENNLKEGDYVKVTRKAEDHEGGWGGLWIDDSMDKSVGKILKIKSVSIYFCSIMLEDGFYYPYFVLEKAEPPKPQYVPFESKEEFISAYYSRNTKIPFPPEYKYFRFGMWIKCKASNATYLVTGIDEEVILMSNSYVSWEGLVLNFEFLDGSPCGKLEVKDV